MKNPHHFDGDFLLLLFWVLQVLVLKIHFAEINIQIIINTCLDRIGKGVLFGIAGIKIINQDQVLDRVHDPVFTDPGGTVFE